MNTLAVKTYLYLVIAFYSAILISSDDAEDPSLVAEVTPVAEEVTMPDPDSTGVNHTMCYSHFLQKDGCVGSSTDFPCSEDPVAPQTANYVGTIESEPQRKRLGRRYDTTNGSMAIHGGVGICGPYDPSTTSGVCLWSGTNWVSGADPQTAGWLNWAAPGNCGKQISIQRQNQPETMQVAPVIDGCNFWTTEPEVGCYQIWMTKDLFDKFNPTEQESQNLLIVSPFTWNFNNMDGQTPENAPL